MRNFREMLERRWAEGKFVCVGLDSELEKIDDVHVGGVAETIFRFNRKIVDATHDLACAYKPNAAFYEAYGADGFRALRDTVDYIHKVAWDVLVILDGKDADIGNTNLGYVRRAFNLLAADAVTVNPYLGAEALKPFLDCKDKGIIVLCRTSNPGAGEFQDIQVATGPILFDNQPYQRPLYQIVAQHVSRGWNANSNCALVVGATVPDELREVRRLIGDMPILIPGVGAQGGDVEQTVMAGKDSRSRGMIINSSRGIIFAKDPRAEAQKLHDAISATLNLVER